MNKISSLIWILVIVVAVFMLYKVKYQVQGLKTQIAQTTRELESERQALHISAAEWAYLNRPERLQRLADKYLVATDVRVEQIALIQDIPFPGQMQAVAALENITPISARGRGGNGDRQ